MVLTATVRFSAVSCACRRQPYRPGRPAPRYGNARPPAPPLCGSVRSRPPLRAPPRHPARSHRAAANGQVGQRVYGGGVRRWPEKSDVPGQYDDSHASAQTEGAGRSGATSRAAGAAPGRHSEAGMTVCLIAFATAAGSSRDVLSLLVMMPLPGGSRCPTCQSLTGFTKPIDTSRPPWRRATTRPDITCTTISRATNRLYTDLSLTCHTMRTPAHNPSA